MGDCNAVSLGQTSHLGLLLQKTSLELEDFIALKARPGRKRRWAGLMIDDFILLEARKRDEGEEQAEESKAIVAEVRKAYEEAGLPRHEGKASHDVSRGEFWGVQINGDRGEVRPNLKRCIPLCHIILDVLRAGRISISLLEVLAGSLVSVFQMKRRFMSALEEVYNSQRGRSRDDVIQMSSSLRDELLACVGLVVVTSIDLRCKPFDRVVASDASSSTEAAVSAKLPEVACREFQRHSLQKGLWNKLCSPYAAYVREKGLDDSVQELPEKDYDMHPVWKEAVETLKFSKFGKVKKAGKRRHINVGEVRAALSAEKEVGRRRRNCFYLHLQDSQVSLAALVKGRSSSRSINKELRESIPEHSSSGIRPFYGFVRTKLNSADDPSRGAEVRLPSREAADWFLSAMHGDFGGLDAKLRREGVHPVQVSELPEENELLAEVPIDTAGTAERRRERREAVEA